MKGIWKSPKSPYFIARFKDAKGKWVNRSTGSDDRAEAERISSDWRTQAARDREKIASGTTNAGISDSVARAERLARAGRLDAGRVRDIVNDILQAAGHDAVDAISNRKWCDDWKAGKRGAVGEKSKRKYDQVARDWLTFLGPRADKPLEAVGRSEAITFRERMITSELSPRTVNLTVKLLRGIYQEAVEEGHIGRNPFAGLKSLKVDDEDGKREPFTKAEVADLVKTAEGDWRGLILLAASSGLRLMDAARLQWRAIDFGSETLTVKTSKTGAVLRLPLHGSFLAWLKEQPRGIAAAPVFPSLAHKAGTGKSGLSHIFKKLMILAGVVAGVARVASKNGRGRTTSQKSFHSLRHFAATQLAAAGVRAEVARQITGHADAASHAGYINADMDALRAAVNHIAVAL